MPKLPAQHKPPQIFPPAARPRPTAHRRGYGTRWQRLRRTFLARHPLCVMCLANGDVTPATVVDHIVPHKGDQAKLWDIDNLQSLCEKCHNRKTAKEDGGFGHNCCK